MLIQMSVPVPGEKDQHVQERHVQQPAATAATTAAATGQGVPEETTGAGEGHLQVRVVSQRALASVISVCWENRAGLLF